MILVCESQLEVQACFTSGICQGSDATVVPASSAVEADLLHTLCNGTLSNRLADDRGTFAVAMSRPGSAQALFARRGSNQGVPGDVIDDLSVDVLTAAEDRQTWTPGGPQLVPNSELAALTLIRQSLFETHLTPD